MISVNEELLPSFLEPSTKNLDKILKKYGNFQNNIPVINVVGTNGKGTTSYFASLGFKKYYSKVGLFISPAFLFQNERIQINNEYISDKDFKRILNKFIIEINEEKLNFFEIYTLIAMWYFWENNVDIAIVEAGIGGRFDTTNLFTNQLGTLLTSISLDHEEILGHTIEKILSQKIGICKSGFLIASADNKNLIEKILTDPNLKQINIFQAQYYLGDKTYQSGNKGLVAKLFQLFNFEIDNSFFNQLPPLGRMTEICQNPKIIIDGAHNVGAIEALVNSVKTKLTNPDVIFASSFKKNYLDEIKILQKNFKNVYFAEFQETNNWNSQKKFEVTDWKDKILKNIKNKKDTLICGSLYFIPIVYEWMKSRDW
ncbi:folylpolyglutamate synthase [Spiroplasma sabaudiense Ar-1343]|uniref:Folylpolyglutamate synthase n=1 Tax=Spiroplasma sabaudiense Ar-1343 TaxID=1276257 RepID=W6AIE2_9MOLU|nr:hypothetical protein [Spiroplasma sabaudiense]AHI53474.1 folylpolyglutamate synthase [Spiroplasma sabaudiense Ar-1343]